MNLVPISDMLPVLQAWLARLGAWILQHPLESMVIAVFFTIGAIAIWAIADSWELGP